MPVVTEQNAADPEVVSGENKDRAAALAARFTAIDLLISELEREKGAMVRRRGDFVLVRLGEKLIRSEVGAEDALRKFLDPDVEIMAP